MSKIVDALVWIGFLVVYFGSDNDINGIKHCLFYVVVYLAMIYFKQTKYN
jgi:hypothetical protein